MPEHRTIFHKIWDQHVVAQEPDSPAILYIDLHLVHEVTSPQAFTGLREKGLRVRRPERTVATMDHSTSTKGLSLSLVDEVAARQLRQLQTNCRDFGIQLYDLESPDRGIVHVIGPELGLTQPGMTIVCGDSHTATHGAFGALAFGIGTSEVEQVLASQCLLQNRPKTYLVNFEGRLEQGVTAKDMILALVVNADEDSGLDNDTTGDAVDKLVAVYWALLEGEDPARHKREWAESCDGGKEMETLYRATYIPAYRSEYRSGAKRSKYSNILRRDAGDDEDIAEGMPWAEGLGYYIGGEGYRVGVFPRWLPVIVAKALSQKEAYSSVKMAEWHVDSGIAGTSQNRRLRRDCGDEAADKCEAQMADLMAKAEATDVA